jgi:YGGT family
VVEYATPMQQVFVSRISQLMWLICALIISVILFRFTFLLIAANAANTVVDLVYDITDLLVAPFAGIVNSPVFDNGASVNMDSLFAIIVYALATWVLVTIFRLV